jgi:hypothetical protein
MNAGRPKNLEGIELVSIDEAIIKAQAYLQMPVPPFKRRTLLGRISRGELTRYGTYHYPMIDWAELKRSLNWRRRRVG